MEGQQDQKGLFRQWRTRLSQALLREPAVVLLEREGDLPPAAIERQPRLYDQSAGIRPSL
ncbi:hypothetical protein [Sphingobium amiense]|uniref:hypothetical protein n=1 Tax=Sphingobium amiense TaxID=135719 RepID=UPI00083554B4|nr:hypothetical protein [Sphingobium amiense]